MSLVMSLAPLQNAASEVTDFLSRALATLATSIPEMAELWADQSVESTADLLVAALAGIAAAIAVALALTLYFRTYRSVSEMFRHGLAAAIALGLLAFVAYDIRHAAAAHLGKTTARPAGEFEQQWQKTTERARTLAAEMDRHIRVSPETHQG
jgi:hypothetical protein